jgi:hypothetical protein
MSTIISLSGRKGCGKGALADEVIKRGFVKVSFADRLRDLVSDLFGWPLCDLRSQEKKAELLEQPIIWNADYAARLKVLICAERDLVSTNVEIPSRRYALQFVGTDVLRTYDRDFHVKSLLARLESGVNYVLDDVRFPNELTALHSLGAELVFIIRPKHFDYSNHLSEISLQRQQFKRIIVNAGSLDSAIRRLNDFLDTVLAPHPPKITLDQLLEALERSNWNTTSAGRLLRGSRDKVVWWAAKHLVPIPKGSTRYSYNHNAFAVPTPQAAYWAGLLAADGCVKTDPNLVVELTSTDLELVEGFREFVQTDKPIYERVPKSPPGRKQYSLVVNSPYILEDMKLWNLEPRKSKYTKIPECLTRVESDSGSLLNYWIVGLIDGDGCIYHKGDYSVAISLLASEQVVDYIADKFVDIPSCKYQEKSIDNLYSLKFNGKNAVLFYERVFQGIGLRRKWSKLAPFLDKKWHH